jgi:hypothetical protein
MFLDAWAITRFAPPSASVISMPNPATRNQDFKMASAKNVYKCPFERRYSFINYCHNNKDSKKPNIFHRVKITKVNYQHTCQLSQPDLNGLNDIIGLLPEKPNLKPDLL